MKKWLTEIKAIDPTDPERGIITWAGPEVPGETPQDAEKYCQENGLGYCNIIGELICEIPYSIADFAPQLFGDHRNN